MSAVAAVIEQPESLADALGYTDDQLGPHYFAPPPEPEPRRQLRLPPYSRHLTIAPGDIMFICSGKRAWDSAKRHAGSAIVLPANDEPDEYAWPVRDCHVVLIDHQPLAHDTIDHLTMLLRNAGAASVMRHDQINSEAEVLLPEGRETDDR